MPRETLAVKGYREFLRACDRADRDTKRYVRETFKQVGEHVRADASLRFAAIDARSAAGFRTSVRTKGIVVQQSRRKTTGKRPDYGSLQMRRGLLSALMANQDETERAFERAIDRVCDRFERPP